jgi:hypothetical protein
MNEKLSAEIDSIEEAWEVGYDAYLKHGIMAGNPYPPESAHHREWWRGFEDAQHSNRDNGYDPIY